MFSQTVEYALRAMVCLAQNQDQPLTTGRIAELARMPASYAAKVLQSLKKAELIRGARGIGGGYVLNVPPADLSVLQVMNVIDPPKRILACPLGLAAHGTRLCPLHRRLDQVLAAAEQAFADTTIAELLDSPSRTTPLCELRPGRKPAASRQ